MATVPRPSLLPSVRQLRWTGADLIVAGPLRVHAPEPVLDILRSAHGDAVVSADAIDAQVRFERSPDDRDEGYRVLAGPDGARCLASSAVGQVWAAQTLRQLIHHDGTTVAVPGVEIEDAPELPWRGALVDVARWHKPMSFVREFVDDMSALKLNVLHLHLTDDQGWRIEIDRYPRLTEVGSVRESSTAGHQDEDRLDGRPHGGFYRQAELRELVSYAAERGVQIMPEIDLPGHMQAAVSAYPEFGNDPEAPLPVRTTWGISPHVLNAEPATERFVRDVLDEVCDVFPWRYVHIGGDEVPPVEWETSEAARRRTQELGLSEPRQLGAWWLRTAVDHLRGHGRDVALWDDQFELGLPQGTLVFGWQGMDRVDLALAAGFDVVAVPQESVYLDRAETFDRAEPVALGTPTTLDDVLEFVPSRIPARSGRVLGSQAMLWSEYMPDPATVSWRAHPRTAAIAQRCWSPEAPVDDFFAALPQYLGFLDARGVRFNSQAAHVERRLE